MTAHTTSRLGRGVRWNAIIEISLMALLHRVRRQVKLLGLGDPLKTRMVALVE